MSNASSYYPMLADRGGFFTDQVSFIGRDFTGHTFKMQVRNGRDPSSTLVFTLTSGAGLVLFFAGTDTVANHVAATRLTAEIYGVLHPTATPPRNWQAADPMVLSTIGIGIGSALIGTVPQEEEAQFSKDVVMHYDLLHIDGTDHEVILRGEFTVRNSVTVP